MSGPSTGAMRQTALKTKANSIPTLPGPNVPVSVWVAKGYHH
jgi:hypothetical protein